MKDAEREKIAASAAAYRRASRVESLPKDEADRLADMDVQEAMKLLDDPVETLRWAVEKLYAHVPAGDTDNHVLFAVRCAVAGHRRSASNSETN